MADSRLIRLRESMQNGGMDAVFVSNPRNVRFLSGFKSRMPADVQPFNDPEGFLLVQPDRCDFLCDGRHFEGARTLEGVTAHLIPSPSSIEVFTHMIQELLGEEVRTVGFEGDAVLYMDGVNLQKGVQNVTWKPAEAMLASLRTVKSPEEVEYLRKAQEITSDCFDLITGRIRPGITEREVALEIETCLKTHSEGCSFDPMVAFGEMASHPHYVPSRDRKLEEGQMVMLDFGAVHEGYCGDLTRMLYVGTPSARMREVYDRVLTAQHHCLDAIKPGVTCHDLNARCRDHFEAQGCLEAFLHSTGHGLGLAIHEEPRIKMTDHTPLEVGMVFTVEPGLYYPGWGGVRIEDVVVVTETGHENLTPASKVLVQV